VSFFLVAVVNHRNQHYASQDDHPVHIYPHQKDRQSRQDAIDSLEVREPVDVEIEETLGQHPDHRGPKRAPEEGMALDPAGGHQGVKKDDAGKLQQEGDHIGEPLQHFQLEQFGDQRQ
jgi:hypothetical protein